MPGINTSDRTQFEDLSAADSVLDQRQTPFWNRVKSGKQLENHLLYSQAVDTMGRRRKNGVPERQDIKGFEGDKGAKIYARGERFQRNPQVSTETEEFSAASASQTMKNYAAQQRQKIIEQKRDINFTCLGDQESQDDDGITGYFFRAAGRTINDGTTGAATSQGGDSPSSFDSSSVADLAFRDTPTAIPANLRTPASQIYAGTLAELAESDVTDMMQNWWGHAGNAMGLTLWCAGGLKRHISDNFGKYVEDKAGHTVVQRVTMSDGDRERLTMGVDAFQGDFGTFTVELEPWMPTTQRGYGMVMDKVMKRVRYLYRHTELENKGGGRRGLIDSILSIWFGDPRSHIKFCPSTETAAVVNFDF